MEVTVKMVPMTAAKLFPHAVAMRLSLTSRCKVRFMMPNSMVLYTDKQMACDFHHVGSIGGTAVGCRSAEREVISAVCKRHTDRGSRHCFAGAV